MLVKLQCQIFLSHNNFKLFERSFKAIQILFGIGYKEGVERLLFCALYFLLGCISIVMQIILMAILVTVSLADGTSSTGYHQHGPSFTNLGACQRIISDRSLLPEIYEDVSRHIGPRLVETRHIGCFTKEALKESNDLLNFDSTPRLSI